MNAQIDRLKEEKVTLQNSLSNRVQEVEELKAAATKTGGGDEQEGVEDEEEALLAAEMEDIKANQRRIELYSAKASRSSSLLVYALDSYQASKYQIYVRMLTRGLIFTPSKIITTTCMKALLGELGEEEEELNCLPKCFGKVIFNSLMISTLIGFLEALLGGPYSIGGNYFLNLIPPLTTPGPTPIRAPSNGGALPLPPQRS